MVSGKVRFQIYIPKNDADALELKDHEELKVTIEKTGRTLARHELCFKKKAQTERYDEFVKEHPEEEIK
ncbi:MAG: hypothetical protein CMH64_01675 [Nanoarchaeota archaeon]|nr:hypothetical protein [Nanoarchaeota archaeon]